MPTYPCSLLISTNFSGIRFNHAVVLSVGLIFVVVLFVVVKLSLFDCTVRCSNAGLYQVGTSSGFRSPLLFLISMIL